MALSHTPQPRSALPLLTLSLWALGGQGLSVPPSFEMYLKPF